ncbi:dolichyl-phosphate-mannose-protein mannosyltransferase [Pseudovirgaria hyperparasitica]|uniref:Dolichyl-phosphate-mannose--protein mannosyltransferase n=1 Tax=Pseudovirgaria hyperparasitica TaxID=470096 RepID=A0A6A6W8C9_9PEZI|nr:dolichyl-phosphate-mannose-protein mannosyltransferase [Pseudovirgaria hyperparasitica]KAF2757331.1 dolichyl-phosphate-mannose-protein mannosyltransferase [Pseudovirgaria hyperparasitica]
MAQKAGQALQPQSNTPRRTGKSPSRSPARSPVRMPAQGNGFKSQEKVKNRKDYTSEGVTDHDIFDLPGSDWQLLAVLTVIASVVRLFRIYNPSSVVFDEVHFGGFASKYIKGRFFMDVHPPLAKLLITLAGFIGGFDGNFDFKEIGKDYIEPGVPYVAMRLLPAICGVMTIPTMFLTLKTLGCRTTTAALGAGLIIFENALLTQSRLILLDAPLVIFTAFTALAWLSFMNQHEQGPSKAFGPSWWFWLVMSGLGLGATASVKWVGLFTIAWVGSLTIVQLWVLLGDPKTVTPRIWFKHFFARVFCLIVIPVTFYMAMFAIHFICLVNPGDGDGFMSSEFQATLNSKGMGDVPADVAFGSRVSIRHHNTQGGYLHSHAHMYPTGSKQQQITLYPHKDENNIWLMENQTQPILPDGTQINGTTAWDKLDNTTNIANGAVVRLFHGVTNRRLHSHDVRPPVTEAEWQNEVSAYGYEGFEGDANDMFRIEIVKSLSEAGPAQDRLRTIQTKFRLVHLMTGCVLFSHKVKLPDWGFEQQEVTCARQGTLPNSVWYIESNEHPLLDENAEKVNYRNPGFFGKFWELQKVMWRTNAGLVESHAWDSRPPSWPILTRGINFWGKHHRQIYLIGNPVVWWSSTAIIALYIAVKGLAALRWQRGYKDYANVDFKRYDYEVGMTILGWAFHYFPFYLMQRQLFLHHYLPALYFAVIALCQTLDFFGHRFSGLGLKTRPAIGQAGMIAFLALSIVVFTLYSPLAYGNPWTKSQCNKVKLFTTWDWDCNNFYDNYDSYAKEITSSVATVPSSAAPVIPVANNQQQAQQPIVEKAKDDSAVTSEAPKVAQKPSAKVIGREEKIEYRDDEGNVLDPEQVSALEGKVSFKTRYETRTRIIDANGNEVYDGPGEEAPGVAPPHPDVEGQNPETIGQKQEDASDAPPTVGVSEDIEKEKKQKKGVKGKPKPASDANEATKQ